MANENKDEGFGLGGLLAAAAGIGLAAAAINSINKKGASQQPVRNYSQPNYGQPNYSQANYNQATFICPICFGGGRRMSTDIFRSQMPCPACGGRGKVTQSEMQFIEMNSHMYNII